MDYRMLALSCLLLVLLFAFAACNASGYGSSVEDLVGAFSIEKTIRLGSSSSCFGNAEGIAGAQKDPLEMVDQSPGIALADNLPPDLAGFDIDPVLLDHSPRSINLTAHIIDDESGLRSASVHFRSPSGANVAGFALDSGDRVSGTPKDGTYEAVATLPDSSEKGAWLLENLTIVDQSGNRKILKWADIARMGLPVEFLLF